ncbi:hypothetical protein [Roseibium sp. Sym1]|uniref:hypothetical protein n=1 Tax=Roseibium sp. Sym1 TaxID=3016006 RepID=UPI0022B507C7|nr:hypothetical protein [Roseibium sp. Sym1]
MSKEIQTNQKFTDLELRMLSGNPFHLPVLCSDFHVELADVMKVAERLTRKRFLTSHPDGTNFVWIATELGKRQLTN